MDQKQEIEYPFYIKSAAVLMALVLTVFILHALAEVFVPLAFSVLFAILLNPLYVRLERRIPKVAAILLTLLFAFILLISLFYFLSTQIVGFMNSLPLLKQKAIAFLYELQNWTNRKLGISIHKQVAEITSDFKNGGGEILTNTLGTIAGSLGVVFLVPTYIFLLLYYKPLILDFLFQVFQEQHSLRVAEILSQTKAAVQSFMIGLMIETAIVCIMNSVALVLIGVPSAIVIGVIGGILNILPYIGGLIAIILPLLMVTITREGYTAQLLVFGSYMVIQFIDNNILVPRIVSKKVQINALISIVVVLLGGMLWGIPGMFLAIPLIGVLKIVFDRVEELKPWGRLLGDEVPTEHTGLVWQKRWERIFRRLQQKKEMEAANEEENS
jgi:predicted PurR-regulated permease PerM